MAIELVNRGYRFYDTKYKKEPITTKYYIRFSTYASITSTDDDPSGCLLFLDIAAHLKHSLCEYRN